MQLKFLKCVTLPQNFIDSDKGLATGKVCEHEYICLPVILKLI